MSLARMDTSVDEMEALKNEVNDLKGTIARLSDAGVRIAENLETEAVLQEIVDNA